MEGVGNFIKVIRNFKKDLFPNGIEEEDITSENVLDLLNCLEKLPPMTLEEIAPYFVNKFEGTGYNLLKILGKFTIRDVNRPMIKFFKIGGIPIKTEMIMNTAWTEETIPYQGNFLEDISRVIWFYQGVPQTEPWHIIGQLKNGVFFYGHIKDEGDLLIHIDLSRTLQNLVQYTIAIADHPLFFFTD